MNEEVIHYVAKNIKSNVRELEGAIISLIAQASFNRKEINLSLAKEIIEKFVKNTKREVSIDYIKKLFLIISKWISLHYSPKREKDTLFKLDSWQCFLLKNTLKHPLLVLAHKLEKEIMQLCYMLAKQLIIFHLQTSSLEIC